MAPPPCVSQQHHLAPMAAWFSSKGIPQRSLLPHVPLGHLSAGNSRLRPGVALQSIYSSSQPLCIPGALCSCPEYAGLHQGQPVWFSILTVIDQLLYFPAASNASPLSQTVAPMWGSDLCFSSLTLQVRVQSCSLSSFSLPSFVLPSFALIGIFLICVQGLLPTLGGVLRDLLHLKMYSWLHLWKEMYSTYTYSSAILCLLILVV